MMRDQIIAALARAVECFHPHATRVCISCAAEAVLAVVGTDEYPALLGAECDKSASLAADLAAEKARADAETKRADMAEGLYNRMSDNHSAAWKRAEKAEAERDAARAEIERMKAENEKIKTASAIAVLAWGTEVDTARKCEQAAERDRDAARREADEARKMVDTMTRALFEKPPIYCATCGNPPHYGCDLCNTRLLGHKVERICKNCALQLYEEKPLARPDTLAALERVAEAAGQSQAALRAFAPVAYDRLDRALAALSAARAGGGTA